MKKLSLNALAFQKGEVLTRSQLKKVLGGTGSDEGSDDDCPDNECDTDADCGDKFCTASPCRPGDPNSNKSYRVCFINP